MRRRSNGRRLLPAGLGLLLGLCSTVFAATDGGENTDNAARLQELRQQIEALRSTLDSDQQRKQDLQSQLALSERHIGKVVALLKGLKRQLRREQRDLRKLRQQRGELQSDLQHQRVALAGQIRAAYAIGQQEYLKILLNQQDPAAVTRTLTYYDYFNQARLKRIRHIDSRLTALRQVEEKIHGKTRQLEKNQAEQRSEKAQLEQTRDRRQQVLAKLNRQITVKGERLSQLLADERRLQHLLDRLAQAPTLAPDELQEQPSEQSERTAFRQLRGRLPWPSQGRLLNRYGSSRKVGKLKWQGVTIKAPEGTEVRAVSHGRVAFSDWLRGFGLLIIIDHGDGYMSLYGGNQSLFKEVGDWVEAGEVIASVGNSGGHQEAALYFEIRHNGKPSNPLKWCRNKPKQVARSS
jgi:septal ring factor EnvC (AmiA/AmiB activator)